MKNNTNRPPFIEFFANKHGKIVIWQKPNLPIIGWFVLMVASRLLDDGLLKSYAHYLSQILLAIWALYEITNGSSYFRRLLGLVILVWMVGLHP